MYLSLRVVLIALRIMVAVTWVIILLAWLNNPEPRAEPLLIFINTLFVMLGTFIRITPLENLWFKWFWQINKNSQVILIFSFLKTAYSQTEGTLYAPMGDIAGYTLIRENLKRIAPELNLQSLPFPTDTPVKSAFKEETLISFGGGRDNMVSRELRPRVTPPIYGRDETDPQHHDLKYASNKEGTVELLPKFNEKGELEEDYAYIIRTVNPRAKRMPLFFFIGAYTEGTWGAAAWAINPANIRYLWRRWMLRKLAEMLHLREKTDSLEVLLKVPVAPNDIGDPRLMTENDLKDYSKDKIVPKGIHPIMFFTCEKDGK